MKNSRLINTIGGALKDTFGEKTVKLSLDGNFTCPNRDGTKGVGGCDFCSPKGSGEMAGTIPEQMHLLSTKWPKVNRYIAYFQNYTSTYAPVEQLKEQYDRALSHEKVVGLAIATRPDCLDEPVLDLLETYAKKTFLWVELGLQTIHEDNFNRCYPLSVYDEAVKQLLQRGIRVVTHLILGLPGENRQQMIDSVSYVCRQPIYGLKLHMLNIVKGSRLATTHPDYLPFASLDDYVHFVCDLLEIIPPEITIHRLTGDVPRHLLLSPPWSYKKRTILNGIVQELNRRNSYQGKHSPLRLD